MKDNPQSNIGKETNCFYITATGWGHLLQAPFTCRLLHLSFACKRVSFLFFLRMSPFTSECCLLHFSQSYWTTPNILANELNVDFCLEAHQVIRFIQTSVNYSFTPLSRTFAKVCSEKKTFCLTEKNHFRNCRNNLNNCQSFFLFHSYSKKWVLDFRTVATTF